MLNYRNPRYNHIGTIDCEIEHPVFGWIPTTLDPNDDNPDLVELYNHIKANDEIAPYEPAEDN